MSRDSARAARGDRHHRFSSFGRQVIVSGVNSVTAGDGSIVIGGTATDPTVETGTLDVIATLHPPAANWSNNSKKITSLANGSGAQDAAAFGQIPTSAGSIGGLVAANNLSDVGAAATAFANIAPLTTKGDLVIENATPAPARLAVGSAGQVLGVASGLPAWGTGMTLLAATPVAGYTLVNGTGTIITWTAPNDGLLHRVILLFLLDITSNETGGTITFNVQMPNGTNLSHNAAAGGGAASAGSSIYTTFVNAGQAAALVQSTALTGGAAILWAEIWGS